MAKQIKSADNKRGRKEWSEGELIRTFNLVRLGNAPTVEMQEWLDVEPPILNIGEQYMFDEDLNNAQKYISGWNEEDLKMKFISNIVKLGNLKDSDNIMSYFDKTISATVENIHLTVKSDFMLAKGTLDFFETPYFHFQAYKPYKNPSGDSMAQLLEAFLIAQIKNKNNKPMYGVDIMGANWRFVTMQGKAYCISKSFDAIDKSDLLTIIAILRKFRQILETKLLD